MKSRRIAGLLLIFIGLSIGSGRSENALPSTWHDILTTAARLHTPGERVVHISEPFLGTPYRARTLVGSADIPEQLVAELAAVDCFTLLDYVEALRRSARPDEFRQRLIEVRYRDGIVAWDHRRHFFTDWAAAPAGRVRDVTVAVGGDRSRQATKQLNRKADGTRHLPGVAVQERLVHYLPVAALDAGVLARLQPGDYLGIYTPAAGLDVTHVGIAIRRDGRWFLRHASSRRAAGQVIDVDLATYLAGKPGLVVLRPQ